MNQEIKAEWVKALRSGEYEQTRGYLRHDDGYCCLGVLCDLAVKAGVIPAPIPAAKPGAWLYGPEEDRCWGMPPSAVYAWVEMEDSIFGDDPFDDLAGANDNGSPFTQIADMIEERL
jgi:hypothetical protein